MDPATPETTALLHAVTEQLMRSCSDTSPLAWFAEREPDPAKAAAAIGRLLRLYPYVHLVAGSPLDVWARGGQLDPNWRAAYPPAEQSVWAELQFLTELYSPALEEQDGLNRLLALRELAHCDMSLS